MAFEYGMAEDAPIGRDRRRRRCFGVGAALVVAGMLVSACSTAASPSELQSQVSTVLTTASNLQPGITEGSCSTPSTNAAPSAPDPGLTFCSSGSTTGPIAKGLTWAADRLAALHFPATDQ